MESIAQRSQEIAAVPSKIDAWRQQKTRAGEAMPASLWQAAAWLIVVFHFHWDIPLTVRQNSCTAMWW